MVLTTTGNVGIGTTGPATILDIGSADLGNGAAGQVITVGRNTNATATGAASINLLRKDATAGYIWQDNTGLVRINTAAPTNANDAAGTIVGTQSSSLASKNVLGEYTDNALALSTILSTPLYNFTYKSGAMNNQQFTGIITDYSPTFGMDKNDLFPNGKSFNPVTSFGYTVGAIKQLSSKLTLLENGTISIKQNTSTPETTFSLNDIVLGKITNTDGSMATGSWVKLSSIKDTIIQWILDAFKALGLAIENGITKLQALTVGSSTKPQGITLYDTATNQPYCLTITNGEVVKTPGTCENPTPAPTPLPTPAPAPTPDAGAAQATSTSP